MPNPCLFKLNNYSMGQDGSKIASKRRVEDGEKVKLLCKENRAAMKLSASEIKTLKQLYHRLASLSPEDEYINKQTFLNYFPLEGVLAERLFATFDKDKNNVIDYEEFLGGLALCLSGTIDEKFQLVFDLYNIDDGDGVSEEELGIVLKSTFMAASAIVNPLTNIVVGNPKSFNIDAHVHNIVKDAFEQCDTSQTGKLSPEEFRTWAEHHTYILDIIFGHKSFTDKQQISENITAATMKAVETNSLRCQSQTWVETPSSLEQPYETPRGYSKATYLWSPVFPVMFKAPKARSEHTVCVYQGVLYLLGGRGTTAYKDFWKYDLALNNWSEITNNGERPSLIFGHTALVHKGSMYVYGGEFKACETLVWKYTFDSNIWQRISPKPTSKKQIPGNRRHHTAVVYDNKMYVFGGIIDVLGCTNELWSFNLINHDWELIIQTPKNNPGARYEHSALVYNKVMWIVGGLTNYQSKNDIWKWNFAYSSWTKIKTRGGPFPIHGHRVVKCGNAMVIFGQYDNAIWKFDFENQNWTMITPHGNVSPSTRSGPAVVTLSAFALPVLPPQTTNTKPNVSSNILQNNLAEELRPRSTPDFKSKQNSLVPRSRHWSLSTDSLYQPPATNNMDSSFSAGSADTLDKDSVVSFTNASYCHSVEGSQFPQCESKTYPPGKQDGTVRPERDKNMNAPQLSVENCVRNENTRDMSERKTLLPNPKEGLCLFLVGGKCGGNHDFFTKGVDIWRCDVTKRRKRSNKVTKINVQTAGTETWSGLNPKSEQFIPNEEFTCSGSGSKSSSPADRSRKAFVLTCRQDVLKTSETLNVTKNPNETSTCYGDLIVTDLSSSESHLVEEK